MHYYKHHIGDFRAATGHLSDAQEIAYRRMLDVYYDTEEPLPEAPDVIAWRVRSDEATVCLLLDNFFHLDAERSVWRHHRCDREIADYRKAVRAARCNGKRGGRPGKRPVTQQEPAGFPPLTDSATGRKAIRDPVPSTQVQKRAPRAVVIECPDGLTPQQFADWQVHRGKHPLTATAIAGFRREAEKAGLTLAAAVEMSIAQNWRGFQARFLADGKSTPAGTVPPRLVAMSTQHIPNMPLGHASCSCAGCVNFRSKAAQ